MQERPGRVPRPSHSLLSRSTLWIGSMGGQPTERSSIEPATVDNSGQSSLLERTSSRSPILALLLALPVGRLVGKATPPHSCSRPLTEEKPGDLFPFQLRT